MKILIKNSGLLLLFFITFISCDKKEDEIIIEPNFNEISNIATFYGNKNAEIIIVNTQGGPTTELANEDIKDIAKTSSLAQKALFVNVHQAQTKTPSNFKKEITFEKAKEYDKESVKMLKKVIDYFKKQSNKKVYVLGISFGAFMTQELIATYGISTADKYLIAVGRLNIDKGTWVPFSQGKNTKYVFKNDGTYSIEVFNARNEEGRSMAKLAAGLGYNRYTEKLASIKDLSKVTYVYGGRDEAVGPLSKIELDFLKQKKATIVLDVKGNHFTASDKAIAMMKQYFDIN
ncbi:conserved hypothetical protein [Tenacibaculum sp. 190524A02b]|uniref:Alpha/beta hydrolase n=1 Tax=Tenacibaculum vairaonense TaxID=3137860 RepID=A0ABM9PMK5_9FLAO